MCPIWGGKTDANVYVEVSENREKERKNNISDNSKDLINIEKDSTTPCKLKSN